jgi:succinoglycan biosynthesis transport protein ExoP
VREHFDRVFHGPDDLERAVGAKPIAVQPSSIGARDARGLYRHVETHPDSPYAQSIFRIKSWVDANLDRAGNLVAVGSAEAGEGKSTTAANLAHLAARGGQKVLLIDGDLHQAALTAALAPESVGSLIDVVSGEHEPGEVIAAASDAGFDFCPARPTSAGESASNIFSSRPLQRLLERVAQAYDLVIVDTPALNQHVDASILLAKSDLAVLLVCQEATTQPQLHRALDMLSGPPADRVAFVLSEHRPRR